MTLRPLSRIEANCSDVPITDAVNKDIRQFQSAHSQSDSDARRAARFAQAFFDEELKIPRKRKERPGRNAELDCPLA